MRAYLQVACAGLGFDIGEVWWTQNENGSSTVAALGEFICRESHVGVRWDNGVHNSTFWLGRMVFLMS